MGEAHTVEGGSGGEVSFKGSRRFIPDTDRRIVFADEGRLISGLLILKEGSEGWTSLGSGKDGNEGHRGIA